MKQVRRKMTEEEKEYIRNLEQMKRTGLNGQFGYLYGSEYKTGVSAGMSKKREPDLEERRRLLELVIDEYNFNGGEMPTPRQLKKSQLFRLSELWSIFGSYDNLCKAVAEELGLEVKPKEIKPKETKVKEAKVEEAKVEEAKVEVEKEEEIMGEEKKATAMATQEEPKVIATKSAKEVFMELVKTCSEAMVKVEGTESIQLTMEVTGMEALEFSISLKG